MPLLDKSLISPHRIYYGCINSDEAGVILNYEVESSFEAFYPRFRNKFSTANWNYQETGIFEDDLNHRMMFLKASTTRHDSTVIDIQGETLESLTNPDRLSITVTFSHISDSLNYQIFENNPSSDWIRNFENNPSTDWILSDPKSALLKLCSDEYWSVWNP
jgi:Tol biopolymer transport system component